MVNPGTFRGSRCEFLNSEKPAYTAGVDGGYPADALALIQRRYFKRFPIDLPHEEEPTDEFIKAVDDDAADPEHEDLDDTLDGEALIAAMEEWVVRGKLIASRKAVRCLSASSSINIQHSH